MNKQESVKYLIHARNKTYIPEYVARMYRNVNSGSDRKNGLELWNNRKEEEKKKDKRNEYNREGKPTNHHGKSTEIRSTGGLLKKAYKEVNSPLSPVRSAKTKQLEKANEVALESRVANEKILNEKKLSTKQNLSKGQAYIEADRKKKLAEEERNKVTVYKFNPSSNQYEVLKIYKDESGIPDEIKTAIKYKRVVPGSGPYSKEYFFEYLYGRKK